MKDNVLINITPPVADQKQVESIFAKIEESLGFVPDGLRLYGVSPALLKSFVTAIGYFRSQERLSQELLATIRYLTANRNHCAFCIDFNEAILLQLGKNRDQLRAAREDVDKAPLPNNEKALLKFALAALDNPSSTGPDDIANVKTHGWSDRDLFDAVFVAANNRAFTTVLKTFGIERQGQLTAFPTQNPPGASALPGSE